MNDRVIHQPNEPSRTSVRRHPERGTADRATIHRILDEALISHVSIVEDGQPFVMPMIHARLGERLYFHGSHASRLMRALAGGSAVCITVTLLDGLVLARSGFNHSMNYRSVVILGRGEEVTNFAEKVRILDALLEHVVPGRVADLPRPTENEINGTMVVSVPLDEASAKIRSGPSRDKPETHAQAIWAGVIPLALVAGAPEPDSNLPLHVSVPDYVRTYSRPMPPKGEGPHPEWTTTKSGATSKTAATT